MIISCGQRVNGDPQVENLRNFLHDPSLMEKKKPGCGSDYRGKIRTNWVDLKYNEIGSCVHLTVLLTWSRLVWENILWMV